MGVQTAFSCISVGSSGRLLCRSKRICAFYETAWSFFTQWATRSQQKLALAQITKTIYKFRGVWKKSRMRLKCDGTRAESRFRLSVKRASPFKSADASVQSTNSSRGVRISGSNAGYTMFRGTVKGTGYPLHSPVSPSLPLPCVTVCHHISTGLYPIYTSPHKWRL